MTRRTKHLLLRLGVSLGLLLSVAWLLDTGEVAARLAHLRLRWVLLALGISVPQVALSAYRWRVTAGRLGIHLPFKDAFREYYVATFLNQVLPGGVLGDVSRAWRHARVHTGPVIRTVILERASGQAVMVATAVFSLLVLPRTFGIDPKLAMGAAVLASGAIVLGLLHARRRRARTAEGLVDSLWRDVNSALLAPDVVVTQLAVSALVVGSYIATYVVAARAVGVSTPTLTLAPTGSPGADEHAHPSIDRGLGCAGGDRGGALERGGSDGRGWGGYLRRLRHFGPSVQPPRCTLSAHLRSRSNRTSSPK